MTEYDISMIKEKNIYLEKKNVIEWCWLKDILKY